MLLNSSLVAMTEFRISVATSIIRFGPAISKAVVYVCATSHADRKALHDIVSR
jgi:hypothetical protein